jgi:hypothetical protein
MMIASILTEEEIENFFTASKQMGISKKTMEKLKEEGIESPQDLIDFDKDTLHQLAENLRKAPGKESYALSAKSHKRMLETAEFMRFYQTIGREVDMECIQYETVTKDFMEQWKSLKSRQAAAKPEVPKITQALPIIKWTETFDVFLSRTIGIRTIPLSYITRDKVRVSDDIGERAVGKPHTVDGSVVSDLTIRASHNHPLYGDDNAQIFFYLEEATRSTQYASSLKPYQKAQDGRGALVSLRAQYAGKDKWEVELSKQEEVLHNREWKGQTNFSLEKFVTLHRNAFVTMQQCAEHVAFQLPTEHTRVGYLLNAIQTSDAGLQAALAAVRTDDKATGKRNNFEKMASYIVPYDPVGRKRQSSGGRQASNVSGVDGEAPTGFGSKQGMGKTGVHLRYYTKAEYEELPVDQRNELREWRKTTNPKRSGDGKSKNKWSPKGGSKGAAKGAAKGTTKTGKRNIKEMISSAVAEAEKKWKSKKTETDELDSLIMSLQAAQGSNKKVRTEEVAATTMVNTSALKSIIGRVRNKDSQDTE